jgi:glycosyltransferase involved in cell wall biosynthesis
MAICGPSDRPSAARSKVLLIIFSRNAESSIVSILERLPEPLWSSETHDAQVLLIDDASTDATVARIDEYRVTRRRHNITVLRSPTHQGVGGIQKVGLLYAIENSFEIVVLLHADNQVTPEKALDFIEPIAVGDADAVIGSRFLKDKNSASSELPAASRISNGILCLTLQNILNCNVTDPHCTQRAYSVSALTRIPFKENSPEVDFNTDIIIQLASTGHSIKEVSVPRSANIAEHATNNIKHYYRAICSCFERAAQTYGIWYNPKFDFDSSNERYTAKLGYPSSHQFGLDWCHPRSRVLDLGCGPGHITRTLWEQGIEVFSIDREIQPTVTQYSIGTREADLDTCDFSNLGVNFNTILALDIIEHLKSPEVFLKRLRDAFGNQRTDIAITTGNIAFLPIRISLLFGSFNYGPRGILDLDHKRLFTFGSLKRLLTAAGYDIIETRGIPAPFPLIFGERWPSRLLLRLQQLAISCAKGLFSYQIALVVRPQPTLEHLLKATQSNSAPELLTPSIGGP